MHVKTFATSIAIYFVFYIRIIPIVDLSLLSSLVRASVRHNICTVRICRLTLLHLVTGFSADSVSYFVAKHGVVALTRTLGVSHCMVARQGPLG